MNIQEKLATFQTQVRREISNNILPFYLAHAIDHQHGGFYGYIGNDLTIKPEAPKSLIQHTRMLWTFSIAHRVLGNPVYLDIAGRAYDYLLAHFWDDKKGGLFWLLDHMGQPLDTRKLTYGQAFGIYGFSEYYLATGHSPALSKAIDLFHLLEKHIYDDVNQGYFEGGVHDWVVLNGDSVDQVPAAKTMNTHLHLLEAYTNLLRAWDNNYLRGRLRHVIDVTLEHIIDPHTAHFKLHFNATWHSLSDHVSYGHDIEGSWLLVEAAEMLDDADLLAQIISIALKMAQVTLNEGIDTDGGIFNEGNNRGVIDPNKDWWPQAEAMVGFLNAYQLSDDTSFLEASLHNWDFIQKSIIDKQYGEWFQTVARDGTPYDREKVGPWKTPYHNGRACLEIMQRIDQLIKM